MQEGIYLIVNADDFGQSPGINRGIIEAHERGIVTSASLMVRWPSAEAAADYCRRNRQLGLGLHVDLGEWVHRDGSWGAVYERVQLENGGAVREELRAQLEAFRELAGGDPDHLDSHQHVHDREPARTALIEASRELRCPLRRFSPQVRSRGEFYGQTAEGEPSPEGIGVEGLLGILRGLTAGITELVCHPGEAVDVETMYRNERAREVKTLCDPRVARAVAEMRITLCSFRTAPVR